MANLNQSIDLLQRFVGAIDLGFAEHRGPSMERELVGKAANLNIAERRLLVSVLTRLVIERCGPASVLVGDIISDAVRAADEPHEHAVTLQALLDTISASGQACGRIVSGIGDCAGAGIAREAVRYIRANAFKPITLDSIASHVGSSKWHCSRVFRRHIGRGVKVYIDDIRTERARQLLMRGDLSIKEIAWAVGFRRAGGLTRAFRNRHGVAPARFRVALR